MRLRKSLVNLQYEGQLSEEDRQAWDLFSHHMKEFNFDTGSLVNRDREAERFTEIYFRGTPYSLVVEESCVGCTETVVYKDIV